MIRVSCHIPRGISGGEVIGSVTLSALNSAVLFSKLFVWVPASVGHGAQVALRYVGVISIPAQMKCLVKNGHDVTEAAKLIDREAMVVSAAKVANIASNILLTAGGFVASAALLGACPGVAAALYSVMIPWGGAATVLSAALDIYQIFAIKRLNGRLEKLGEDGGFAVTKHFELAIQRQLDPETAQAMRACSKSPALFAEIQAYCRRQEDIATADMGLRALGYVAMALCRTRPNTLIESSVLTGFSLFYTIKLIYQKFRELQSREKIELLTIPKI